MPVTVNCRPSRGVPPVTVEVSAVPASPVPCPARKRRRFAQTHYSETDRDQYLSITVTATANNIISMGSNISRVAEGPGPDTDTVPLGGHRLTAAESRMNEPDSTRQRAVQRLRIFRVALDRRLA